MDNDGRSNIHDRRRIFHEEIRRIEEDKCVQNLMQARRKHRMPGITKTSKETTGRDDR